MVNIDAQLNEPTFREAEFPTLHQIHPAYRTLLEKRRALEEEKRSLSHARDRDAENPAGDCTPDP